VSQIPSQYGADGGELFDLGQGKLWLGFVLRSVRRHLGLFLATFLTLAVLGTLLALSGENIYYAGSKLIAARPDSTIIILTNPNGSGGDPTNETPAQAAEQLVKSQANLTRMVEDLKLVEREFVGETKVGKAKRQIFETIFSAPDLPTRKRDMIDKLRTAITVSTSDRENIKKSVNIDVLWSDPGIAKLIADAAGANFLKDGQDIEIDKITKARDIAQAQVKKQKAIVDKLRDDLQIPEFDERPIPESSPLKGALNLLERNTEVASNAEIALKATKASFASRFGVTTPAELPIAPVSGGLSTYLLPLIAAAMVGAFVTTLADVLRGRVVEPWQITRKLNLPLLADLKN
jgi:uncharacterized protein involved in exopolysaccharide biosynthesis